MNHSGSVHSVLKYAGPVEYRPYPHIVIHDALDYYEELDRTRPGTDAVLRGYHCRSNERVYLNAPSALAMPDLPPIWREFIEYHASPMFWRDICNVFGPVIAEMYPKLSPYAPPTDLKNQAKALMRCALTVNAPVTEEGSTRGPHIDSTTEIIVGLFYMPQADDTAGGELEIHEPTGFPLYDIDGSLVNGASRVVKTVPYKANTLAMFVNSPHSIHAVTPRKPTTIARRMVNFAVDVKEPAFVTYGPADLIKNAQQCTAY